MEVDVWGAGRGDGDWLTEQRRWARGWRRVIFPGVFLAYLAHNGEWGRAVLAWVGGGTRIRAARSLLRGLHLGRNRSLGTQSHHVLGARRRRRPAVGGRGADRPRPRLS